ncbi:MAG: IS5 family transposase, partial [Janthinobacterium lividum]
RQAEAFSRSVLSLLRLDLAVPDHTTLSRRGRGFAGRQPRTVRHDGPVHLVLDSTGLQLFGQGEWDAQKHGRTRRQWRKLHLGVDAGTGEIAAHILTEGHADDAAQAPGLFGQLEGCITTVSADGAYDSDAVYQAAARQHDPPPDVVIPPRACAVPSTNDPATRTPRDRHIQLIVEKGRMAWQRATGYGRRSLVETAIGRYKHLIGPKLRARTLPGQQGEAALAVAVLNRMIKIAKPVTVPRP